MHEAQLLAPSSERHSHVFLEKALEGSLARAGCLAYLCQGSTVAGMGCQDFSNSNRSRICRMRKSQRDHLNHVELVEQYLDEVPMQLLCFSQAAEAASMEN